MSARRPRWGSSRGRTRMSEELSEHTIEHVLDVATIEPRRRVLAIPELSLVALIGPSGCGKSTFARTHFTPFETLASDFCRGLVSNDENDQTATKDAFEALHFLAAKRLARGLLTVVDATN